MLQYALNHKENLQIYLKTGNCVISNNIAENSIKPFTVAKKTGNSVEFLKEPKQMHVYIHLLKRQNPMG
ncbi:IS66 family transposase [Tissierella praeacuta]|nr:IS66 family transposase [Tissierella praeacuta]